MKYLDISSSPMAGVLVKISTWIKLSIFTITIVIHQMSHSQEMVMLFQQDGPLNAWYAFHYTPSIQLLIKSNLKFIHVCH